MEAIEKLQMEVVGYHVDMDQPGFKSSTNNERRPESGFVLAYVFYVR